MHALLFVMLLCTPMQVHKPSVRVHKAPRMWFFQQTIQPNHHPAKAKAKATVKPAHQKSNPLYAPAGVVALLEYNPDEHSAKPIQIAVADIAAVRSFTPEEGKPSQTMIVLHNGKSVAVWGSFDRIQEKIGDRLAAPPPKKAKTTKASQRPTKPPCPT